MWPIDRTLSGATTSVQSGQGSDCNEGVLHILPSSSITGLSPSDCLYLGYSLEESYSSAEMKLLCILQHQPNELLRFKKISLV